MTRPCGCGGAAITECNCAVVAGPNVTVTGTGIGGDPYVVSADPLDCADVEGCLPAVLGEGLAWDAAAGEIDVVISTDPGNLLLFGGDGGLYVSEDGLVVPAQPRGRIGRTGGAAQPIPSGLPATVVAFDAAMTNIGGVWAGLGPVPNRLTAPISGGYNIGATVRFSHNGSPAVEAGARAVQLRLNGAVLVAETVVPPVRDANTTVQVATQLDLVAGDYLEVLAFQTEGAALTLPVGTFPMAPVAWMYYTTEGV